MASTPILQLTKQPTPSAAYVAKLPFRKQIFKQPTQFDLPRAYTIWHKCLTETIQAARGCWTQSSIATYSRGISGRGGTLIIEALPSSNAHAWLQESSARVQISNTLMEYYCNKPTSAQMPPRIHAILEGLQYLHDSPVE
jgi:hypothetical protein